MSLDDAESAVIQPMEASFPAPHHVRANRQATETLLNVYRRALERFDRPSLELAWQKTAAENELWTWPMPSELVRAAERFQHQAQPVRPDAGEWVERAQALADSYVRRFMKTVLAAVRAREGRYEAELRRYVQEASWVQSQLIVGRQRAGYSAAVLFGYPEISPQECREKAEAFIERAREQPERGFIKVQVPLEMVVR